MENKFAVNRTLIDGGDLAVRSQSCKSLNQDFSGVYQGTRCNAIAIADGLGSSFDANVASKLAVEHFLAQIQDLDQLHRDIDINTVGGAWARVARMLQIKAEARRYCERPDALQSTLATVIELEKSYLISYLGNGSILHIRGDFWSFWDRHWPWCMTDLMLGHSFLNDTGQDTLYGIVAPRGLTAQVRFVQIWKDAEYGDIFVLCSDGISSPDHLRVGRDADEKLWIEVNPHLEALISKFLKYYFEQLVSQVATTSLIFPFDAFV